MSEKTISVDDMLKRYGASILEMMRQRQSEREIRAWLRARGLSEVDTTTVYNTVVGQIRAAQRAVGGRDMIIGGTIGVLGLLFSLMTAAAGGGLIIVATGAIFGGGGLFFRGLGMYMGWIAP